MEEENSTDVRPKRSRLPSKRMTDMASGDCAWDDGEMKRVLRSRTRKEDDKVEGWESRRLSGRKRKRELPPGILQGCEECAFLGCSKCRQVFARWRPEKGRRPYLEPAPTFHPTEEEFKDPLTYIASIRSAAEPFGICKVVPPKFWNPPCALPPEDSPDRLFPTRVQEINKLQVREASKGRPSMGGMRGVHGGGAFSEQEEEEDSDCFGFHDGGAYNLKDFKEYADDFKQRYFSGEGGKHLPSDPQAEVSAVEGEFWRIVEEPTEQIEVLYGADIETAKFGSGFPPSRSQGPYEESGWNLNNIAKIPGSMLSFEEAPITGVLVPWLYVGICLSSFCWHVEDHHLYSVNFLHFGSPKVWYGIPGPFAPHFESAMRKHLPHLFLEQPSLLQLLVTQLSPSILQAEGVPVYRLVQSSREFVVTFPRAYHGGFNTGYNCAEAVNFAPVDWLPHGLSVVEEYRKMKRATSISTDKLLLAAARRAIACTPTRVLAEALESRLEVELKAQQKVKSMGVVKEARMDKTYDATGDRDCLFCHYDLHLSAIGCPCSPDKYTCLGHPHFLCECPLSQRYLLTRLSLLELHNLAALVAGRQSENTKDSPPVEPWGEVLKRTHVTSLREASLEFPLKVKVFEGLPGGGNIVTKEEVVALQRADRLTNGVKKPLPEDAKVISLSDEEDERPSLGSCRVPPMPPLLLPGEGVPGAKPTKASTDKSGDDTKELAQASEKIKWTLSHPSGGREMKSTPRGGLEHLGDNVLLRQLVAKGSLLELEALMRALSGPDYQGGLARLWNALETVLEERAE